MNSLRQKATVILDDIYETSAFQLLAQGMKDRQALDICASLLIGGLPDAFNNFNRWCEEMLNDEQAREQEKGK